MTPNGTASVLAARPVLEALDERHIDPSPVLRTAGLTRQSLASVEQRLPYGSMRQLWESAAGAAHDRCFGVHVAERLAHGGNDLFDYLISAAATLGDSFSRLTHYVRIFYDESDLRLIVEPKVARLVRHVAVPATQYEQFLFTWILLSTRRTTGVTWSPERMKFQHEQEKDDGELTRIFGCPVAFGASELEMCFARSLLALPNEHPDSRLLAILMRYADTLLQALPVRGDTVAASAASEIARQLAKELPTLSSTAAVMRMPERTLQRRLTEMGSASRHSSTTYVGASR